MYKILFDNIPQKYKKLDSYLIWPYRVQKNSLSAARFDLASSCFQTTALIPIALSIEHIVHFSLHDQINMNVGLGFAEI